MEGKITRRISGVFSSQSSRVKEMIRDINDNPDHPSLAKRSIDDRKKVKEQEKVEGYLQKLGEKGIVKGWKTRWFVLDQNILSYYRERSDPTPISFILLQTVKSVYVSNSMEINHKGFDFVLNTDGRDYILSAGSEEDRLKWVQAVDRAREEACKPIVSSITKHNAAVAAGTATTQTTPSSSTLTLSSKSTSSPSSTSSTSATSATSATSSTSSISSTPTSTSPPKTSSSSSAAPAKGFARSGGRNNSAARAGIRMSDSRTLQKELQKLENPAAYFDEDGAERTGLAIGAGRRGKSTSLAPPPKSLMAEDEDDKDEDEEIKSMREKYKKEEQEELEIEAAKRKLEEEEKLRKQEQEDAKREEERVKREAEEAKREEDRLKLEQEAKRTEELKEEAKRAEEVKKAEEAKRDDMAKREAGKHDHSDAEKTQEEEQKTKEEKKMPIKNNGQDTQESYAALSSSPCSLSLSSSASSSPSATPSQSPDSSPTPIKRTDRQNSFTRAASMSSLLNGNIAIAEAAPAALLKPPAQRFDNVSPLTSDDERELVSAVKKGDSQTSAQPLNPFESDPQESPRKVEVKHEEKKSPKKSPRTVENDPSQQEPEPEVETSYVRKKIVFRKSVMPQQPLFGTSSMLAPGSSNPTEDMGFGYNSFSGMPTDYGGQYPYASQTAKVAARASLSTSLESVKNRFTVNAEGYMQVTSGTELRTIIGRAIASNGQSTLPGIQVGPFFFDFENGVWKLNIQKGSNEIGPRSESKEEYLESLREKKQKAIEDEDYNLASFYKHKEQSALTMESEIFVLPGGIVLCYRNSKWEITECPSQPGLSYIATTPKKEVAPPPSSINTLASSLFNPLQSLQSLLDNVVQVDPEDEEAVALLTQLEEAVSIIVVHFKDTTAPTPSITPPPTPNAPNFSQVLVSNLTRTPPPNPPSITHTNSSTTLHTNVNNNNNFTYNTNVARNNLYSSSLSSTSTTTSNSSFLSTDGPFTVNNNNTYRSNASPTPNRVRQNEHKNSNPAAAIAAAAAATNAKKLNALVRGKFCTALAGVLANGLRKQLHILSLQEPHMWDFMEECGTWPKHAGLMGLSLGQTMKTMNSAMQDPNMKYRSLICEALNTKSLRDWLQLMMSYDTLTEKYFEDFALIRHHAVFQKYIDCVARLNDLPFELDVMYEAKMQRQHAQAQDPAQQTQAQQPAQVLANIGSLFSSFLAAPKSAQDNNGNGDGNSTGEKPKGLFGFKSVFNM